MIEKLKKSVANSHLDYCVLVMTTTRYYVASKRALHFIRMLYKFKIVADSVRLSDQGVITLCLHLDEYAVYVEFESNLMDAFIKNKRTGNVEEFDDEEIIIEELKGLG